MDPAEQSRPALIVKVDNTAKGRPQEALAEADIVYVAMIEGGTTRLAVVYQSEVPDLVGPIRSGRTTDIALFSPLNNPIFSFSGANRLHLAILRQFEMVNLGAATRSEYLRDHDRPGTYDLMTKPADLWAIAEADAAGGAPPPQFEYRAEGARLPDTAQPVDSVRIAYPSMVSMWTWSDSDGGWLRTQAGTPHVDASGARVIAKNVLVAEVGRVATGSLDTVGSTVFEEQFLGSGRGWVFTDGQIVDVTWTNPSINSVATWTTADGIPVALLPGQTWVELAPAGSVSFD